MNRFGCWDLTGQIALVTGGTKGIGLAISKRLSQLGAHVGVDDIFTETKEYVQKALKEIRSVAEENAVVKYYQADVSNWEQVQAMVKQIINDFGKIDILINNAGITGEAKPVVELPIEEWEKVMNVDLKGTFLVTKAVLPYMIKQNYGRIVNMSSVAGKEGNPNMSHYCGAKHGIIGFTKAVARELVNYNIRVNAVCPALIQTPLLEGLPPEQIELLKSKIPLRRLGKPEEVADLVVFLVASEAVNFITGQTFNITGGRADY